MPIDWDSQSSGAGTSEETLHITAARLVIEHSGYSPDDFHVSISETLPSMLRVSLRGVWHEYKLDPITWRDHLFHDLTLGLFEDEPAQAAPGKWGTL